MQSVPSEKKRNQRKSPLTPKKSFRKEDSPPAIAMRVGGRVKKAKIPFDPSDAVSTIPKRRQTDSCVPSKRFAGKDGPVVQHNCCHCKKNDKPEMFVNCKGECATRIHLNCLQSICENFGKNEELSWSCYKCQICTICDKGAAIGKHLLKCYICFSCFHPKCHGTEDKIKIIKENRFCCNNCGKSRKINTPPNVAKETVTKKTRAFAQTRCMKPTTTDNNFANDGKTGFLGFNASNEVIEASSSDEADGPPQSHPLPIRRQSSQSCQIRQRSSSESRLSRVGDDNDNGIIEPSEWSIDQVFKYFRSKFPRHAHVLKDHEIDGPSLLMLKRGDVIRGFDIKIGPALKLYGEILMIQTRCKDETLSWS